MTEPVRRAVAVLIFLAILGASTFFLVRSETGRIEKRFTHQVDRITRQNTAQPIVITRCSRKPLSRKAIQRIVQRELGRGSPGKPKGLPPRRPLRAPPPGIASPFDHLGAAVKALLDQALCARAPDLCRALMNLRRELPLPK